MHHFRHLPRGGVRTKSSASDLVTIADEEAETAITAEIQKRFPTAFIVGEEAASANPSIIEALRDTELGFVIDPIDGTANYAAGLPLFGIMLAVVAHGETIAAIIHDPVCQTSSMAMRGAGAIERDAHGNEAPLKVAPPPANFESLRGMASWRFADPIRRAQILKNLPRITSSWDHRCAAHEYRALITANSDFVFFNRLMPWDHLPGVLLHQESGGAHRRLDGSPYRPGETRGGLIAAADRETCDLIHQEFFKS